MSKNIIRDNQINELILEKYSDDLNSEISRAFHDGVNWAECHPSEEMIERIFKLRDEWLNKIMKNSQYESYSSWIINNWDKY